MSSDEIRVYIDETRHLQSNASPMVLGALWGKTDSMRAFSRKIKVLRSKYQMPINRELKWTKVSRAKLGYYVDVLNLFFEENGVNYRAIIIDKELINNKAFCQTDDDFYYKMQYYVVRHIAERNTANFKLFFDYKDTWSNYLCKKTAEYLNSTWSLSRSKNAVGDHFTSQTVQSYEAIPLQVADLLNGLIAYANAEHGRKASKAKKKIVEEFKARTPVAIDKTSPYAADKVNLFFWKPEN